MSSAACEFKVYKMTATHGDALKAIGLADLLQSMFEEPVWVAEEAGEFVIRTPGDWRTCASALPHSPRYPWLKADRTGTDTPPGLDVIDISEEFERVKRWSENRKKFRQKAGPDPELQQLIQQDAPRPRWWIVAAMTATKLKAISTWNRVAQSIAEERSDEFREQVLRSLNALSSGQPSDVNWKATSSGLFCPSAIKGFNELKPRGTSRGSVAVDDFEEWLRYLGYWQGSHLVSDSDNIRVYVPIPMRLTSRSIGRLASRLESEMLIGSGPKSDILVVLALARLLIEYSREYHEPDITPDPELSIPFGATPANVMSGLHVTHFTKTSQRAYGVQATAVLALPDWFPITTRQEAEDWLSILDEHRRVIAGLRDDRSDEIALLIAYRRFLEKRGESAVCALIEFMERYGAFVMRANGARQGNRIRWVTRFTDGYFRRILMGTNGQLVGIINDPGFDAVARAVRQATVTAQNKRARQDKDAWREVRYELFHDIHRTRKVPGNAFVECVSEFISRYNYENARHREIRKDIKAAPANVSDEELKSFFALVDLHGTAVVGALLAAYGSCKEKWEGEDNKLDTEEAK
jgi:hypothetical protein